MIKLWFFIRPSFKKTLLLLLIIAVSAIIVTEHTATSKVSWQEERGIPLSFMNIVGYEGPCSENGFCRDMNIQSFNFGALIIDIAGWYLISCTIAYVYQIVKKTT